MTTNFKKLKRKPLKPIGILLFLVIPTQAFASEWAWTTDPTPGASNIIVDEEGENVEEYTDGTLSNDIILSEIMPNPEGTDTDFEWIEIYNTGTQNVDLGNWMLDDAEEGSDPYTFPAGTLIEAQDFLVIYRSESDISLNNDTDEVRLFDYENNLKDSVSYGSAPEGQSYARISLEDEDMVAQNLFRTLLIPKAHAATETVTTTAIDWKAADWQWTNEVSLGKTNPIYHFIKGTIKSIIAFEDKIILSKSDNSESEVTLSRLELNDALKKTIFQPGKMVSGYALFKQDNTYELLQLDTETLPASDASLSKFNKKSLYLTAMLILGGALLWFQKKKTPFNVEEKSI